MSIFYNATFRKIKTRWLTNHMTLRHKDRYYGPILRQQKKTIHYKQENIMNSHIGLILSYSEL